MPKAQTVAMPTRCSSSERELGDAVKRLRSLRKSLGHEVHPITFKMAEANFQTAPSTEKEYPAVRNQVSESLPPETNSNPPRKDASNPHQKINTNPITGGPWQGMMEEASHSKRPSIPISPSIVSSEPNSPQETESEWVEQMDRSLGALEKTMEQMDSILKKRGLLKESPLQPSLKVIDAGQMEVDGISGLAPTPLETPRSPSVLSISSGSLESFQCSQCSPNSKDEYLSSGSSICDVTPKKKTVVSKEVQTQTISVQNKATQIGTSVQSQETQTEDQVN